MKSVVIFLLFICTVLSINGTVLNWNKGRGYDDFTYGSKEGVRIENFTDTLEYDYIKLQGETNNFNIKFRSKFLSGNPTKAYSYSNKEGKTIKIKNPQWGFFITGVSDTLVICIRYAEKKEVHESMPCLEIILNNLSTFETQKQYITKGFNPYSGENLWSMTLSDNLLSIGGGDKSINSIYELAFNSKITGFGFFAGWGSGILIQDIQVTYDYEPRSNQRYSLKEIVEKLSQSEDRMEGYWTIFDRELEESLLKLGGTYEMACVKVGYNYYLIYLEGARTNSAQWQPGDIKGILKPSSFKGVYDVEWFDAMKMPLSHEIKAQWGDGETLLIQFPYHLSKLRLRKIDK